MTLLLSLQEVSLLSRWMAMTLLQSDVKKLRSDLSITLATPELMAATGNSKEPYRFILKEIDERIIDTLDWLNSHILCKLLLLFVFYTFYI